MGLRETSLALLVISLHARVVLISCDSHGLKLVGILGSHMTECGASDLLSRLRVQQQAFVQTQAVAGIGRKIARARAGCMCVTMKRKRNAEVRAPLPQADLPVGSSRPKLVVFDLDNTLWSPELYQLKRTPKAERDIWLFDGARAALHELTTQTQKWEGTRVAIASRTNQVEWAKALLAKFEVAPGVTMEKIVAHAEIFPGSKRKHFQNLKRDSGVPFCDMIFFDDSTMNTREMEMMGILCVHCPRGLTFQHWEMGLQEFARMKEEGVDYMGVTVSVSATQRRNRGSK